MNEIIKMWKLFIEDWKTNKENLVDDDMMKKPQFYDFMKWLSEHYNL